MSGGFCCKWERVDRVLTEAEDERMTARRASEKKVDVDGAESRALGPAGCHVIEAAVRRATHACR